MRLVIVTAFLFLSPGVACAQVETAPPPTSAKAQDIPAERGPPPGGATHWTISAGPGLIAVPRYPGADRLRLLPVPAFDLRYGDLFFASVQSGVGFNLLRSGPITAGVLARPDFGRPKSDARRYLRGLPSVDFAPEVGGFAEAALGRALSLRIEGRRAIGGHDGFVVDLSATYARPVLGRAFLALGPKLRLTDGRHQRAYFGVTPTQSVATGFAPFRPAGGLTSMGFAGALSAPMGRWFSLTLAGGYDRLIGDPAGSPVVRNANGSKNQPFVALALSYVIKGRRL